MAHTRELRYMSYETARDLPSFREMEMQLKGMKFLKFLLPADQKHVPAEIKSKLDELANLIDDFYECFGDRNWILNDMLNIEKIRQIIDNNSGAEDAEKQLIEMYSDPEFLKRVVMRCNGIPALRKRIPLIEKALADYLAGRYYSTVLTLITVIDGFVNELESSHRGAHTRSGEELSQYDSPISHHKGLASVQGVFLKPMSVTKEEPVYEVYRHGIVHGIVLNFDNIFVAAKSWNMLLAFMDWTNAKAKSEKPKEPEVSLWDSLKRYSEIQNDKKLLDKWRPFELNSGDDDFEDDTVVKLGTEYYDAWMSKNYGKMSTLLSSMVRGGRENLMPKYVRQEYENYTLKSFKIHSVNHYAAGGSDLKVNVEIDGMETEMAAIRWIYEDKDGNIGISSKNNGDWRMVMWGTNFYIKR